MNWQERYVGLPFVDHGRDFQGVDCWGLVALVLWHERRITVPSYGETSARDLAAVAGLVKTESAGEPWSRITQPRAFDVAVMCRRHAPVHVGIMVSGNEIMHVEEKISAVVVPIDHATIRYRNPQFFRHRALLCMSQ